MMKSYIFLALLYLLIFNTMIGQVTNITVTLVPGSGGEEVIVTATDNGDGLVTTGVIRLMESTSYEMMIDLGADQSAFESRGSEIQFFFQADEGLIDGRIKPQDMDDNGLEIGFISTFNSDCSQTDVDGEWQISLGDFSELKSDTSSISGGETVFSLNWEVILIDDPTAPPCENEEEVITDVVLTWTPVEAGETIVARAKDPDGEGPLDLEILDDIHLTENTSYVLSLKISNEIEGEDITEEIENEADEHMFFYSFTEGIFSNPLGDGNIDVRQDLVNYLDTDQNGFPLGLMTEWTTASEMDEGLFRLVLKHQPDIKSNTSTVEDGSTDIDLVFNIMNEVTGVFENRAVDRAVIYPNPVRDILQWENISEFSGEKQQVQIYDISGRMMLQEDAVDATLFVYKLLPGLYTVEILGSSYRSVGRFVKL